MGGEWKRMKKKVYKKPSIRIIHFNGTKIGALENGGDLKSVVIPDGVTSMGRGMFSGCSGLTIYCEAKSKPSGWDVDWNPSECPVYWYSEEEPALNEEGTAYEGNFWKYNENGEVMIWKKETI